MHGPRKYRRGSGEGGPGPSATSFFSHQLNLHFFKRKLSFFKTPESVQHFYGGGGGGQTLPRGGQSIRIQITCDFPGGGFGPPFPLWILA